MENTIGGPSTTTTSPLPPYVGTVNPTLDLIPIYQAANVGTYSISRNAYLGLASQPIGLTDTQSPTNKTFNNTNSLTVTTSNLTIQDPADNTKQANFLISGNTTGTDRIYTLPNYNGTFASLAGTETLTNKTLTSPVINAPTITQASITADTINGYTTSNAGTIYGLSVTGGTIGTTGIATSAITSGLIATNAVGGSNISASAITLGFARITTTFTTGTGSTFVAVTGLTVTVTVPAGGRNVKITTSLSMRTSGIASTQLDLAIFKDGSILAQQVANEPVTAYNVAMTCIGYDPAPTAGSHTYAVYVAQEVSSSTLTIGVGAPGIGSYGYPFILVEAI